MSKIIGSLLAVLIPALIPALMPVLMPNLTLDPLTAEEPDAARLELARTEAIRWGIQYLRNAQGEDGLFSPDTGIGPTIIVLMGLLRCDVPVDDPIVVRGLDAILSSVADDGGIYSSRGRIPAYESSLAISCLKLAIDRGADPRYAQPLEKAEAFIRSLQYGENTNTSVDDVYYGGVGYGADSRPDLSCTQYFIDALRDLGAGADDEAMRRALVFVSRCQNYDSGEPGAGDSVSGNNASKGDDGGFIYTCVGDGQSPAGETEEGLRSYGSITYAGLKSLIYAGLTADDPRVQAASGWIRENYTLDENPGLGRRGLYYYYHTMAKTLNALELTTFTDAAGKEHPWRQELVEKLLDAQRPNGSWVNDNRMWMETDPVLVTGYALIVLSFCRLEEQ